MKIGIIEKPGVLKIAERDIPKVQTSTDVLVKVKRVGICDSDIHIFQGRKPFAVYPRVWGMEPIIFCGTCYAAGKGGAMCASSLR